MQIKFKLVSSVYDIEEQTDNNVSYSRAEHLGGNKNVLLSEMSSQQSTVKHPSMSANAFLLPSYTIMRGSAWYKACNLAKCSR